MWNNNYLIFGLGFLAQLLFSSRMLVQWILSERARKVVSPQIYWQLSIAASVVMAAYGWLRHDFAIILGQILTYFIYIYNLKLHDGWRQMALWLRVLSYLLPLPALVLFLIFNPQHLDTLFTNQNIPMILLVWGSIGQVVFTMRFVYQWQAARKSHESVLPLGFWNISLCGSLMIISYAIYRHDPVLLVGQSFGAAIYGRNIWLSTHGSSVRSSASLNSLYDKGVIQGKSGS